MDSVARRRKRAGAKKELSIIELLVKGSFAAPWWFNLDRMHLRAGKLHPLHQQQRKAGATLEKGVHHWCVGRMGQLGQGDLEKELYDQLGWKHAEVLPS